VLRAAGEKEQAFWHIYLPDYIEQFGADHFDLSMRSLEEITQLVSAEFAIRPFILRYPEKTMKQMLDWSRHPAASVRRLASEGCRPRLPWAIGLPMFKKDPAPILPILENLKQDPSEYVRRSVANNLNDIAKDHPGLVLKMAARWKGISPETDALIRHGSRTLLKRGNDKALHLHGFNPKSRGEAKSLTIKPRNLKVGDSLSFSFQFTNRENTSTFYRLEYRIWYLTSTGKTSQKVFRIAEKEMRPKESITFTRTQRFTDFTTRKHYPGRHQIEILANGISRLKATFRLVRA
jgi:3-methyladenine DNA glycosylase AlkC